MSNATKAAPVAAQTGEVTFVGETAGYQNVVGMYKIAADGSIHDVEIVFANASLKGSGGDLLSGVSKSDVNVAAGDKVGFFVVPNGYAQQGMSKLLGDQTASYKFVDAQGNAGNVNGGTELKLVQVSATGAETAIKSAYGTSVFHSVDDGSLGLNGDKLNHVKVTETNGTVKIGFEDLKGGGDKDFDDSVITFRADGDAAGKVVVQVGAVAAPATAPASPVVLGSELLKNGSFEESTVGANTWTHNKTVGAWQSDSEIETWGKGFYGIKATDGDKIAELDYDRGISNIFQNVQTEAGAEYSFKFDYMKRPDSPAGSDTINVFWNGKLVGTVDPTKPAWETATFKVEGTGGLDRIEFKEASSDNDSYGGMLDNVSLKKTGLSTTEKVAAEKAAAEAAEKEAAEKAAAEAAAKEAAEKAAAEAAAKEAAEKAAAEAAAKEAAEKAAAEAAAKEAAEKASAEAAAKEAAEKAAAEAAAKEAAEKAAAEAAAKEAAEKAAAEAAAKEAAEKAAAEAAAKEAAEKAAAEAEAKAEKIVLSAHDSKDVLTNEMMFGADDDDAFNGGKGNDIIFGGKGSDVLSGDTAGAVTVPLSINANLVNSAVAADAILLTIGNLPADALLSAGVKNADGTWSLTVEDLNGLKLTASDAHNLSLSVRADAVDGSGLHAETTVEVTFQTGADDMLVGNSGNDLINGDAGNDVMYGGSKPTGVSNPNPPKVADNDVMHGGDGNDTMYGNAGDDVMTGDAGNDWMSGGKGNDVLSGGDGDNVLFGNTGDDRFVAGGGNDSITGGAGFDTIDFSGAKSGVTVDLHNKTFSGFGTGTVSGVEAVDGSTFDDVFVANSKGNVFTGNGGNDTYAWYWGDAKQGGDIVTDFNVGDVLDLSKVLKGNTANLAVKDGTDGTHVFALLNKTWTEVVTLEGYHGSADEMLKAGAILAG